MPIQFIYIKQRDSIFVTTWQYVVKHTFSAVCSIFDHLYGCHHFVIVARYDAATVANYMK